MLRDKFLKVVRASLESNDVVDPALVVEAQAPVVAAIDNAVSETPAVIEPTDPVVAPVATDVPVETSLPAPTTAEAIDAVASEPAVEPVVAVSADPVAVEPPTTVVEVVASVEAKGEDDEDDEDKKGDDDKKADDAEPAKGDDTEAADDKPAEEAPAESASDETPAEPAEPAIAEDGAEPVVAANDAEPAVAEPVVAGEDEVVAAEPAAETPVDAPAEETPVSTDDAPVVDESTASVSDEPVVAEPDTTEAPVEASEPATVDDTSAPLESAPETPVDDSAPIAEPTGDEAPAEPASTTDADLSAPVTDAPVEAPVEASADEAATEVAAELDAAAATGEQEVTVDAIDEDESYADQLLEMNGMSEEAEELEVAIESLVQRAVALESIAADLTEIQRNDEVLTPEAAEMLQHAVASETAGLIEQQLVPSMESFLGRTAATRNTKVSLEGVQSALETVWKWLRSALIRAGQLFASLWRKLMDNSAMLVSRAKNIKDQASRLDDSAYKSNIYVSVSPTAKRRLTIDGRPIVGAKLITELDRVYALADDVIVNFDDVLLLHAKLISESMSSIDLDNVDSTVPPLPPLRAPKALRRTGPVAGDENNDEYENSSPLLGDNKVKAILPNATAAKSPFLYWTQRNLASVSIQDTSFVTATPSDAEITMPLLKGGDLSDIATRCISIAEMVVSHRKQYENSERYKQILIKAGDDFAAMHAQETGDRLARAKTIANVVSLYSRMIGNASNNVSGYALKCVDASLRLAQASLDYYRSNPNSPKPKPKTTP